LADYILRHAELKDFPGIRALILAVRINPTVLDWRHFIVAVNSRAGLLGCGQIKLHKDGSREMASIAVQENARGQGIARAIIEELVRQETRRPLYLMCRATLEPFYDKFGFRTIQYPEMPPYFLRISKLARIFNPNGNPPAQLLVMRLD
jgi:N-acetylglutamate synthase-like GNAT family acetyltransferase